MKNSFHVTICFYQHPLALNEIYNWYNEHIKEVTFFRKYRETNETTPFENIKFLFMLNKEESNYDEINGLVFKSILIYSKLPLKL